MTDAWKTSLLDIARDAGFMDARVADARPAGIAAEVYTDWIRDGFHGEMSYLEKLLPERTSGLDHILPGARSIIVFAASYYHGKPQGGGSNVPSTSETEQGFRVARYALGTDYHYVLKDRLLPIIQWLDHQFPGHQWRAATDSAPIMERTYAAQAGLGFIGKNGMLITWLHGSFTLLASIVTTAPLTPDEARAGTCGQCTRCISSCPTQAFIRPGLLDAKKCISYLTIEKKSILTPEEVAGTGEWVFGCDICQDVCPYNKTPSPSTIGDFAPGSILNAREPASTFLGPDSNRQFERRFKASPLQRAGKRRIQTLVREKIDLVKQDEPDSGL